MTALITGAGGQLGRELRLALADRPHRAAGRADLDVTELDAVRAAVAGCTVVFNAAAYTAVDAAEGDEESAARINALGAQNVAVAAREAGALLVHVSTDYVFDGAAEAPYPEDAPTAPRTAYGRTKAAGERAVLAEHPDGGYVVRTAWLYGAGGPNFARTMLGFARSGRPVSVVDDQRGQPTAARDLAARLVGLADAAPAPGIYHGTNAGSASWFEFARAVYAGAGADPELVSPTDSAGFPRPAARPAYSVLGHDAWRRAGLAEMRPWREAFDDVLPELLAADGVRPAV